MTHSLYFSCIPLTTVRIRTALLGTAHVSKYLLKWLVVPRNPLEPSSLPFYLFISRKDLWFVSLFTCPLIRHPARPLKSSPRMQFSQVSRTKRWSLRSPLQQGMVSCWGKLRMPTTEKLKKKNSWVSHTASFHARSCQRDAPVKSFTHSVHTARSFAWLSHGPSCAIPHSQTAEATARWWGQLITLTWPPWHGKSH